MNSLFDLHVLRRLLLASVALPLLVLHAAGAQTISTSNLGANQVTLGLTSPVSGTGSFTVLAAGASCGNAAQTANGQDRTGAAAFRRGSLMLTVGVAGSYTIHTLVGSSSYTVCFTPDGSTAPSSLAFTTLASASLTGNWQNVGNAGFSAQKAFNTSLAFSPDGTPYVAYVDAAHTFGATVMRYTAGTWSVVGNAGFSAGEVVNTTIAFAPDGTPYVSYVDDNSGQRATVMRYTAGAWSVVGTAGFSPGGVSNVCLTFAPDGSPYVAFQDLANNSGATVMRYASGTWSVVGSAGFSAGAAKEESFAFAPDGTPWIIFDDGANQYKLTAMKYSAGRWSVVGGAGFTPNSSILPSFAFAPDGTPYVAFQDEADGHRAKVMAYANGVWTVVGGAFSAGFADTPQLSFGSDGFPYVAFADYANNAKATVMRYSAGAWNVVGTGGFSAAQAGGPSLAFGSDGTPYIAYTDEGNNEGATVMTLPASPGGLSISPNAINFASTNVGMVSAFQTATLSNAGSSAVYLSTPSLTDTTDFTQSDNCGGMVTAGGSCTVTFTFTPKTAGSLSSTYSIADLNNQSSPLTVALSGTGTAPYGLTISPSSITFASTAVGASSRAMTATLTLNGGSTRVNLTAGSLTDSTDFTQGDNCGGSITPNGSCVVTFTFTPKSSGALRSTYSIGLQGGGSPVTVALSGTGAAAMPALTPSALNFGSVPVGTTSSAMNLMLSNTGNAALSIQSVTFATSNGSFAQTNTCGSSLAAGASCTIAVTCSQTATGSQRSTLNVNFPSPLPKQSASLSCTGTAPTASLSPGSYAFPSTQTGSMAPSATFTLANAGTAPLAITSFSVTGTNAAAFPIASNGCESPLAAGSSCNIAVSFAPSTTGTLSAVLRVVDAVGTQTATLTGTAISTTPPDFTLTATPATQSAYHGGSVTYTVQLASVLASNPFNSAVNLSVAGLPVGATASFSPASVTPGTGQPTSQLTVNIPALTAMASPASSATGVRLALLSLGGVIFLLPWSRRHTKRSIARVLPALLLALVTGMAAALSGCGSGNGFATPTETYTLTITGTGNGSAHTTTVNLTVK